MASLPNNAPQTTTATRELTLPGTPFFDRQIRVFAHHRRHFKAM